MTPALSIPIEQSFGEAALQPAFKAGEAICWQFVANAFLTNVRWQVIEHSLTGLQIGYPGSGPADLALNVLAELLQPRDTADKVICYRGVVSRMAYRLHQPFKFHFLCSANRQSGRVE
jgi:hypothetical protein